MTEATNAETLQELSRGWRAARAGTPPTDAASEQPPVDEVQQQPEAPMPEEPKAESKTHTQRVTKPTTKAAHKA